MSQNPQRPRKIPEVEAFLEMSRMCSEKLRPSKQLKEVVKSVMAQASVIVTTCNGGYGKDIRGSFHPAVVIVDEAAQTDEPDTLIALTGESVEAVILVGDTNQLQPVVVSAYFNEFGPQLERSMQSRLIETKYPSCTLRIQYRMLPQIADWPNKTFYERELVGHKSTLPEYPPEPLRLDFANAMDSRSRTGPSSHLCCLRCG